MSGLAPRSYKVGVPEEYKCSECSEVTTVFRPTRKDLREPGHRKHMWCLECKRFAAHTKQEGA